MAEGFPSDNLYMQNLPGDMTEETIKEIFGAIGYRVVQCKIMPPTKPGVTTCVAMVRFVSVHDAKTVLDMFNGTCLPGFDKPLAITYVAAKSGPGKLYQEGSGPAAMAAALAAMMGGGGGYGKAPVTKPAMMGVGNTAPYAKPEASDNLYIKGLPGNSDEAFIEQLFNQYGTVRTVKVLKKGEGPNCHALVRFSSAEEAATIMSTLNGGMLEGFTTPLEINYAVSKSAMAAGGEGGYSDMGASQGWATMMGMMGGDGGGPTTEQMLDEWVKAKRTRDYATADSLRATLRAQGVDPDTERPKAW
eukprot:TRINITY_DN3817_c0_g4_i1.p1 TRINITY_DN3817_c0_g4~~TRINITY_DN3817_c0_g4_i1.p1  ORF type:complete len:303 (+),score=63.97 TRINITY_DN3817_c0_g4_i1:137-1045(+)